MGNIQEIPPSVLESWPEPNLVNPIRRSWMPAFALIWQIASTILVWGRFYLRVRRLAGPFGYDDVFMLIAWMSSVAFTACAWHLTTHLGVDRHTWDVPITLFSDAALFAWILQVLMLFGSGATKASVLLFYRRLVTGTLARRWKLAIYFALAFHAAYLIGNTLGYFLICRPLRAYWMSFDYEWVLENHSYTCADAQALNPVVGVLSIVSDVYAVVLPFVILHYYTLDVPRSQRIGLNIIFATGLLVAGAGVGRTYYLIKLGKTYDTSWTGFDLLVWTIIELQLGIICACAPSLRAFFRRYLSGLLSRTFGSSSSKSKKSRKGSRTRSDPSDSAGRENAAPAMPVLKGVEEIDMRVLTGRDSESSSGIDDPQMQGADGHARPASPAATYASRSTRGGREGREVRRWNSGHSVPCSSKQSAEGGIARAQETHSPV